jgi:hypothetical protein
MRTLALAAVIGVGFTMAGVAAARPYTDPAGRITFDAPANWPVTVEPAQGFSYIIAGDDDNECRFIAKPNPATAASTPYDVRRAAADDAQFTQETWLALANSLRPVFPNNSAVFLSKSRDDTGFWPMQRAELDSPGRHVQVHAGIQIRPGFDLTGLCINYTGEAPMQTFDAVLRSMGHPNDATFRAEAERQMAERDERIAANAATATANAAAATAAEETAVPEEGSAPLSRNLRDRRNN